MAACQEGQRPGFEAWLVELGGDVARFGKQDCSAGRHAAVGGHDALDRHGGRNAASVRGAADGALKPSGGTFVVGLLHVEVAELATGFGDEAIGGQALGNLQAGMQRRRAVAATPAARVHECRSKDDEGPGLQLGIPRLTAPRRRRDAGSRVPHRTLRH